MWDPLKSLMYARRVLARQQQGKPPYEHSPEEQTYFDARSALAETDATMEEINARTIELRDAAYPLGDYPGSDLRDIQERTPQGR